MNFTPEERRKSKRFNVGEILSKIADNNFFYRCTIINVSETGFKVSDLPTSFDEQSVGCVSIIHAPRINVKITVQPCWTRFSNDKKHKEIGFKITDPPQLWREYISQLKPEKQAE